MQTVSQSWKDAHKQTILNESFVEISLDVADPDSIADASATDNGAAFISDTSRVTKEEIDSIPYGTLEPNLWVLDGSRKHIPMSDYKDGSYIGNVLSGEDGGFTKIPTVTINFTKLHTNIIPGVTIIWGKAYGEYATHFLVTAYNGNTVVARKEVSDNKSVVSIVSLDIPRYNRITVQIVKWCLPNRRVRIDEIFLGWHKVYSKGDLMSYSHTQSVDPITTSLPKMEIKFSIDNSDNSYNPLNINGLAKYLIERQEVDVRYGLKVNRNDVEWITGGKFYLSEWYAKQNGIKADFVARDILEFMSDKYKDTITTKTERTLYDLAILLLEAANLPLNNDGTPKWVVDESLKSITTTAPLPEDTIANCLQLVANAGKCVIYPDRNGMLHIAPIDDASTDYVVNSFNSYSRPEITLSKPIKKVACNQYSYSVINSKFESKILNVYTYTLRDDGETITVDNPLITTYDTAGSVAKWIGNYYKNRTTVRTSVRADVRVDALDIISNEHDYGTDSVRLTDVEFKFNGAFRGTGQGRVI